MKTPKQVRLAPSWNCEVCLLFSLNVNDESDTQISSIQWLHRVAHSYDGDQHQSNLLFGTSECNTDMIRTEILVRRFTLLAPDGWSMKIKTTMADCLPTNYQPRWCDDFIPSGWDRRPLQSYRLSWATAFIQYEFLVSIVSVLHHNDYHVHMRHWLIMRDIGLTGKLPEPAAALGDIL